MWWLVLVTACAFGDAAANSGGGGTRSTKKIAFLNSKTEIFQRQLPIGLFVPEPYAMLAGGVLRTAFEVCLSIEEVDSANEECFGLTICEAII